MKPETQVASIQFSLVIIMTGMMLLEHVLACGWFGVGYYDSANGRSWLQENNLKEVSELNRDGLGIAKSGF